MEKEAQFRAVYKGDKLKDISIRYKKETSSGFVWTEENLSDVSDVIEIKKAYDHEGKPTISIRAYGKLEEVFQR